MNRLGVTFCGIEFENPFVLAASPCTDELEMVRNGFQAGWSGAVLKSTHSESLTFDMVSPMLWGFDFEDKKVLGLGNIDLVSKYHVGIVEERVRDLKQEFPDKVVIVSIVGIDKETWQEPTRRLVAAGADAIECSSGCPNDVKAIESTVENPRTIREVTTWVKEAAGSVPVFVKLSSNDLVDIAQAAKDGGGDALVIGSGRRAIMGVDLDTFVPYPSVAGKSCFSSYTGSAIKPIILRMITEVAKGVETPIIAGAGIMTWQDVLESMLLGASIVQIATAVMSSGFRIVEDLKDGIEVYCEEKNISRISSIVGKALPNVVTQYELSREHKVVFSINRETCIKDDLCYISCRDGGHMAIELDANRIPKVDEEKCVGCGLCQVVCPVWDCVTLKPRDGSPRA